MIVGERCGRRIDLDDAGGSTKTRPHAGPATTLHKSTTVKPARGSAAGTPGTDAPERAARAGKASMCRRDSSAGYGCALASQADRPTCGAALPRTSAKMPASCAFGSRVHSSQLWT
jgi:hypothetical protein